MTLQSLCKSIDLHFHTVLTSLRFSVTKRSTSQSTCDLTSCSASSASFSGQSVRWHAWPCCDTTHCTIRSTSTVNDALSALQPARKPTSLSWIANRLTSRSSTTATPTQTSSSIQSHLQRNQSKNWSTTTIALTTLMTIRAYRSPSKERNAS